MSYDTFVAAPHVLTTQTIQNHIIIKVDGSALGCSVAAEQTSCYMYRWKLIISIGLHIYVKYAVDFSILRKF